MAKVMKINNFSCKNLLDNRLQFFKFWLPVLLSVCFLVSCGEGDGDEADKGPDRSKMEEAKQAFAEENYDKAKRSVEYFLAQYPEDVNALYFYAQVLLQTGQLIKAREKATEILAIDPTLPEAKAILGDVHFRRKEFFQALELSREALTKNPNLQASYRVIGEVYLRQGHIKEGIEVLLEAHKLAPNNVETIKKLTAGYLKDKNYVSAKKYLDMAMEIKDNVPGIHYNLAVVYANQSNGEKAMEHIDLALENYMDMGTIFWVGKSRDLRRLIVRKFKIAE